MKRGDQTDIGGVCEKFLTTHWSLIESIQSGEEGSEALIGSLVQQYWKLVYHGERISQYSYESLAERFSLLVQRPWMDCDLKDLFARAAVVCQRQRTHRP